MPLPDGSKPLRLAVLQTTPFEGFPEDLTEEVVGNIKHFAPAVEIASHQVAKMKLYTCSGCNSGTHQAPCRINEINASSYRPDDQLLVILDSVRNADMVLLVGNVRARGLNATAQNLLERFECTHHRLQDHSPFHDKVLGVVIASYQPSVWEVSNRIVGLLNHYGFIIPPYGSLPVTSAGHPSEEEETDDAETTDDVTTDAHDDTLQSRDVQEGIAKMSRSMIDTAKRLRNG